MLHSKGNEPTPRPPRGIDREERRDRERVGDRSPQLPRQNRGQHRAQHEGSHATPTGRSDVLPLERRGFLPYRLRGTSDGNTETIALHSDVMFEFDRADLTPEAEAVVRRTAETLEHKSTLITRREMFAKVCASFEARLIDVDLLAKSPPKVAVRHIAITCGRLHTSPRHAVAHQLEII